MDTTWPPSCSSIPDEMRQRMCMRCKELLQEESRRQEEELPPGEDREVEEEVVAEEVRKPGILARLWNRIKTWFG